jgi:ribosomal protein S18 acetylase RimI-like enzyme
VLENIQKIRDVSEVSYPIWGEDLREQELILKAARFEEKLAQVAMSIRLEEIPKKSNRILIKKVTDERMANTWSQLFLEAFGYEISAETVTKTMNHMEFFVGMHNEIPIGTAILFIDKFGTAGIHSMGIIPSQRRQGFAEELLIHTLHSASGKGASLVTLQASAMGKGLYLKTGFQEDFIIKTFIQLKN